jgi:hypothetical protein
VVATPTTRPPVSGNVRLPLTAATPAPLPAAPAEPQPDLQRVETSPCRSTEHPSLRTRATSPRANAARWWSPRARGRLARRFAGVSGAGRHVDLQRAVDAWHLLPDGTVNLRNAAPTAPAVVCTAALHQCVNIERVSLDPASTPPKPGPSATTTTSQCRAPGVDTLRAQPDAWPSNVIRRACANSY